MNVSVVSNNGFLFVKPACLSVLSSQLTYLKSTFEWSMKDRKRVITKTRTAIYSFDQDNNTLSVPAGMTDTVLKTLKGAGYVVDFKRVLNIPKERRELTLEGVDLKSLRSEQVKMLEAIIANSHTTGKAATGAGKSFMISYICRLYKKANIVITTDAVDVIKTLNKYLTDSCGEEVGQVGAGKNVEQRITVATLKSLHKLKTKPDILIIDECHVVGSDTYMAACLVAASNCFKVIGLSASPEGRGDNASMVIEAVCGPIRVDIPYQSSVQNGSVAQLHVKVYPVKEGPSVDDLNKYDLTIDKDRVAIFNNTYRNELIRKIVLHKLKSNPDMQILVYTEKTEHALILFNLLRDLDFDLVHGIVDEEKKARWKTLGILPDESVLCNNEKRELLRKSFSAGSKKRMICTRVWQKGVDFPQLNLLIRADASAAEITADQASGRLSRTNSGQKTSAEVVDFKDNFNNTYLRRYKDRLEVYNNHGWSVTEERYDWSELH